MIITCAIYALTWPLYALFSEIQKSTQPCRNVTDGSSMKGFSVGYFVYFSLGIAVGELAVWLTARIFLRKMKFSKSVCNMMSESEFAEGFKETKEVKLLAKQQSE